MIPSGLKPGFLAPAGTLQKKPPHGQPCNRCGLCCVATLCPLARHVFRRELGPCPALEYADGQSVCGLVAHPMRHAPRVAFQAGVEAAQAAAEILIGSGTGCDARFNGETPDQDFYGRLREWDHKHRAETRRARKVWGI